MIAHTRRAYSLSAWCLDKSLRALTVLPLELSLFCSRDPAEGMTQQEIAEYMGISQSMVSQIISHDENTYKTSREREVYQIG